MQQTTVLTCDICGKQIEPTDNYQVCNNCGNILCEHCADIYFDSISAICGYCKVEEDLQYFDEDYDNEI